MKSNKKEKSVRMKTEGKVGVVLNKNPGGMDASGNSEIRKMQPKLPDQKKLIHKKKPFTRF